MKKGSKIVLLFIAAAASCGAGVFYYQSQEKKGEQNAGNYKTETVKRGTVSTGITEDGTVEFGTQEQVFSVAEITEVSSSASDDGETGTDSGSGGNSAGEAGSGMESQMMGLGSMGSIMTASAETGDASEESTVLTVEEVYLAVGQAAEEGDPVLKITQESIDAYRSQLEAAIETAKLSVSQEEINVESKRAEADYTYQMYLAEGETAQETYEATIASLENAVAQLEEDLEEALEDEDDEEAEALEAELQIAKNNLTTQSIEAKQTYENAMTNYRYAEQLYEIDTNGLEDDLEEARETLEEAEENLADFEEQIGDGIVYAQYSGTITEISYEAGDSLVSDAALATFTDSENVVITVSVSQEDISQIAVGDEAGIQLTAYEEETFPGEVTGITTSTSMGSSAVNYEVSVRFTGDIGKVYSGMTGEVNFAGKVVENTLYISNRAVFLEEGRSYVKVLEEDGSIQTVEITTGFSDGTVAAVESGLEEGQTVIIESKVEA